ncbi:hypothetical protein SAMN05421810_101656 [Amycolatopsis arida]|uniref:Uncharacterized protein n=1 Tax=Amycolatopsis arida TaxID=587909 RepID=A0A1I5LUB5_9PSEU|nr:hypothetical protein [Amycolatopsis arida]TDX93832.1 hypothetical protein CLV69_104289 [Amycolatopsis arida]SFP00366.1 hypothetical protein SAMN05421810_101656 [Amycolatopsis arida]
MDSLRMERSGTEPARRAGAVASPACRTLPLGTLPSSPEVPWVPAPRAEDDGFEPTIVRGRE